MRLKNLGWLFLLLGVALLLGWSVSLLQTFLALRQDLARASSWVEARQVPDPAVACDLVQDTYADLLRLQRQVGVLAHLGPALGWLPVYGGDLAAAPHLLAVADGLAEAGAIGCDAFEPLLAQAQAEGGIDLAEAATLLAERRVELEEARAAVSRACSAWAQVDAERLSPWLADKAALLERALPLLQSALDVAVAAPDLLGVDAPRTYLILALNEDERRPIGGYITGVGEARVEGGLVTALTFRDSYSVDDFSVPYPEAPEPLRRVMGIDLWVLRDSNWSPDFPTAARQAIELYRPGYPVTIDGVVALDQYAVQELITALGPLTVEGFDEPVSGATVIAAMRSAWAPEDGNLSREWWLERKEFMGPLAEAVWQRLESGQVPWLELGRTLLRLLEEKHLLIYSPQPDLAAMLARQGWDGAMRPGSADYLMVVDANLGYNKANLRVQEALLYQVNLAALSPQATLTLVYTHTSTVDYPCLPEVRYDPVYEQMMDRCYWDYLRVYVPAGSVLQQATAIPVPAAALWSGVADAGQVVAAPADEGPWTVLSTLWLLPPGTAQTRSMTWTLSPAVVQWVEEEGEYTLRLQKQAGTAGPPLTVRVRLPQGRALRAASPEYGVDGDWVVFELVLDRDQEIELRFE